MSVSVRIPTILRNYTDGASEVTAEGTTLGEVLDDLESNHSGIKACGLDDEGRVVISTYPTRAKAANLRRDPAATVLIHSDEWDGPYVQLDGTAEVIDLPDSVEPLVDYFRSISGEHPDWDEYRQAMRDQGKSLIRVTIEQWGPIATGGFPPGLAEES